MKYILIYLLSSFLLSYSILAQTISGTVYCEHDAPLEGALVTWLTDTLSTTTNAQGEFEIKITSNNSQMLVAKADGHVADTLAAAQQDSVYFKLFEPVGSEVVTPYLINGTVKDGNGEPLVGANVYWANETTGTSTNNIGEFELSTAGISNKQLIASFVGHTADTLSITDETLAYFTLFENQKLTEVVVKGQRDGIVISNINTIKTEQITEGELVKAACCDLAGCFETQLTVAPQTTNVVTNAKELRILGLSGVYNQVLIDGLPMIQGASYTYGISTIPGTLVNRIYVAKGANSVLQGYESISGQINVITKKPDETDVLLLNAYMNSFLERQFNANITFQKDKWSQLTAIHTTQPARRIDRDLDNFIDVSLLTRYMLFNKWKYSDETQLGWNSQISLRYTNEQRIGGQMDFNASTDKGSSSIYGQSVQFNQPEFWSKTSYRFNTKHNLSLFASGFIHNQNSFFGTVQYDAKQTNAYTNLQYELNYASQHDIKTGLSYRYLSRNEIIDFTENSLQRTYAGTYEQVEQVPGLFAENTMRFANDKFSWMAGVRLDRHNQFGWRLTPRTLLKYSPTDQLTIRANAGTAWRSVHLFSENVNLLASSRELSFQRSFGTEPESAVNYGVNITQKFERDQLSGYLSLDVYRTDFQTQFFPDYDSDPTKAIIRNFGGKSASTGFQIESFAKFWQRVEVKAGYNFLDVYRRMEGVNEQLPFNARHRVLGVVGYKPLSGNFHIDMNFHWYSRQRLPDTQANPAEFQRPDFSNPFALVNAQFTYNFKQVELYTGCENIFDFRQKRPIISWEDPFSPYFDTSSVWGPTQGREFYLGIRFKLGGES